ncbi:hypothetical protein BH23ACT10_BH23ACT10_20350 [soil metagenome]
MPRNPSRSAYRRRRPLRALLVVALLAAAAAYVLFAGGLPGAEPADTPETDGAVADDTVAVDDLFDDAVDNPDGSVTVTASEAQTAALVAAGLARSSAPALRDIAVDLVAVDDGAPGRMIVTGRLDEQPVPVRATVDLDVADSAVRPTVRDVRIGPLGVPDAVRSDLNHQLRELVVLSDQGIAVSDLQTTDTALEITGNP